MNQNIIYEYMWQFHKRYIQTDGALAAAAPPAAAGVREADTFVVAIELFGQVRQAFWQVAFGFDPQGGGDDVTHHAFYFWIGEFVAILQVDDDILLDTFDRRAAAPYYDELVAFADLHAIL